MALFLTILDRFKNHIFYERKRMKKLALFLRTLKKGILVLIMNDVDSNVNIWGLKLEPWVTPLVELTFKSSNVFSRLKFSSDVATISSFCKKPGEFFVAFSASVKSLAK
jgi:hypothetical protein